MNTIGVLIYFIIIGISHLCFGLLSTKHRFDNWTTIISYVLYLALFIGLIFTKLDLSVYFIITFVIYLILYTVLSKGNILTNMFLVTSYLTFMIIYFGITFCVGFIQGGAWAIAGRWIVIVLSLAALQSLTYLVLIPQFRKAEINIKHGWALLLVGDLLFSLLIYMQLFYPFRLNIENPWGIVLFTLSAIVYFFVFIVVFNSFSTTLSYNQEKAKNDELTFLAHVDALTGLYNKFYFSRHSEELENEHKKNRIRGQENTVVVVLDIDKFKFINDTFGHLKGDEVLRDVADEIKFEFKDKKKYNCFRVGGDEFVVIAYDPDKADLDEKIALLKKFVKENCNVTISAGYSYVDYDNIDAITTAFKNADKIMYQEKILHHQ